MQVKYVKKSALSLKRNKLAAILTHQIGALASEEQPTIEPVRGGSFHEIAPQTLTGAKLTQAQVVRRTRNSQSNYQVIGSHSHTHMSNEGLLAYRSDQSQSN